MGPKGLLQKANSATVSAIAFFEAYREYLLTSEVSYATAPIVAKVDAGELFPTPALDEIKHAVMGHIMLVDLLKAKESVEKASKPTQSKKPFQAVIRDGSGSIILDEKGKEVKQTFDLPQRASEWCDRRLFEQTSDCFGEVFHHGVHYEFVNRDESLARILKPQRMALHKVNHPAQSKMGFGVKVKESKCTFSHG
jgi:hypothetical protein